MLFAAPPPPSVPDDPPADEESFELPTLEEVARLTGTLRTQSLGRSPSFFYSCVLASDVWPLWEIPVDPVCVCVLFERLLLVVTGKKNQYVLFYIYAGNVSRCPDAIFLLPKRYQYFSLEYQPILISIENQYAADDTYFHCLFCSVLCKKSCIK